MASDFTFGEFISPGQVAALVAQARGAGERWLELDPERMRVSYNQEPFLVSHRLADHPKFTLTALFALCRRLGRQQVFCRAGKVPIDAEFDSSLGVYNRGFRLADAIEHLEEKQAYIVIYNPERDAEYRPIIAGLLGELASHTERVEPGMNWYSTYIFISAQDSVTPYHMDREMNFLLQVRGRKTVRLWDPFDEEIMTPAEKDLLLSYIGGRPRYRPEFESKAMIFQLEPGLGVHHPFIAPHLVHTGAALSISLAITFRTRRSDMWSNAHRFNQRLRRFGVEPRSVGRNAFVDQTKGALFNTLRRTAKLLHRDQCVA